MAIFLPLSSLTVEPFGCVPFSGDKDVLLLFNVVSEVLMLCVARDELETPKVLNEYITRVRYVLIFISLDI